MRRDVDGPFIPAAGEVPSSGITAAASYWYHADDMFTVAALTDATGAVAERYHNDDYGAVRILDDDFNLRTAGANGRIESAIGNPHGFTGRGWVIDGVVVEPGEWGRLAGGEVRRHMGREPVGVHA